MDLYRIINELLAERDRVNRIIESLELMSEDGTVVKTPRKRGRKRMDASARRSVSLRMKQYWAKRRAAAQAEQK
jgi:hypothetical protein